MPTINLSDDEAKQFAGWLSDRFDNKRRDYENNIANDYNEDAADDLKVLVLINTVYKQLDVPLFDDRDLFIAHGVKESQS